MTISNLVNIPVTGDGKLAIGTTGAGTPTIANLTAGTGISITNAPGSITIANSVVSSGYVKYFSSTTPNTVVSTAGNIVTFSLPANTANTDGDLIELMGEVLISRATGTFAGNLQVKAGSTTTNYYAYSVAFGTAYIGFFARMLRTSSSTAFIDIMVTGNSGQAAAVINTSVSIDFTNSATIGTAFTISGGTGTATQRMSWIRVTGA